MKKMVAFAAIKYRGQVYMGEFHNHVYAKMLNCLGHISPNECEYGFVVNPEETEDDEDDSICCNKI